MANYRVDKNRTLRDYRGNRIGEVDYWNRVRDGYRDRGSIGANDRYTDEYGRDQGWALPDYSSDAGGGLALLLVMGFIALFVWLISALSELLSAPRYHPVHTTPVLPKRTSAGLRPSSVHSSTYVRTPPVKSSRAPHPPTKGPANASYKVGRPTPTKPPKPKLR